jgi:hypothetical protein
LLWAILDESALRREVGSAAIMRGQCQYLMQMRKHSHVVVQVIPDRAGLGVA